MNRKERSGATGRKQKKEIRNNKARGNKALAIQLLLLHSSAILSPAFSSDPLFYIQAERPLTIHEGCEGSKNVPRVDDGSAGVREGGRGVPSYVDD